MTNLLKAEDLDRGIVCGVVYTASDEPDGQGDYVGEGGYSELYRMAESWARNGGVIKLQHAGRRVPAVAVESAVTGDSQLVKRTAGGEKFIVPALSWYITAKIDDDEIMQAVRDGSITGWSMAGQAETGETQKALVCKCVGPDDDDEELTLDEQKLADVVADIADELDLSDEDAVAVAEAVVADAGEVTS